MNEEQGPAAARAPAASSVRNTSEANEAASPHTEFLEVDMEWPGVATPSAPPVPTPTETAGPALPVSCEPERPSPAPPVSENVASTQDTTPLRAEEAWLEVVAADGAKLTIRIPVSHLMNASALVREFRSQG